MHPGRTPFCNHETMLFWNQNAYDYADLHAIIFSTISSIAGRLAASFAQHRLIRFHALSHKGGFSIRGGRLPLETFFTICISCTPSKGITPNWICTSIRSIPRSDQVENKQEHCCPPRNKDSQTHICPTFVSLSSIGHHPPTLRRPPLHPNLGIARVRQSCNAVLRTESLWLLNAELTQNLRFERGSQRPTERCPGRWGEISVFGHRVRGGDKRTPRISP